MDIYILHDGQASGPYNRESAQELLHRGEVAASDFAWRSGMADWVPLRELLVAKPPAPTLTPADKFEPATAKQKALLTFLSITLPADLSRDQAARMVNDAMEDPKNTERLTRWNEERLRLHPELFAAEIQAKKENRASHFFELCQTAGAEYFSGITRAHCQVLVGFLDVKFPHWDAREGEAADQYFFPAVAEKFPQLVHKQWRGRLHYADGMKVADEIIHKSPAAKLRPSGTSPLAAVTRGLALGVLILGVLYLGYRTMHHDVTAAPAIQTTTEAENFPATTDSVPAEPQPAMRSPIPAAAEVPPQNLPPIEAASPSANHQSPPVVPTTRMNDAPRQRWLPRLLPLRRLPSPAWPRRRWLRIPRRPWAPLPGTEPPAPVPAPSDTTPAPVVLPSTLPSSPIPAPTAPETLPSATVARTNLLLTKPVEIQLTYGKIMLASGTAVRLVSRQGATLKVSYQNNVINVPVTSTDPD